MIVLPVQSGVAVLNVPSYSSVELFHHKLYVMQGANLAALAAIHAADAQVNHKIEAVKAHIRGVIDVAGHNIATSPA